jgi:FMN reductase
MSDPVRITTVLGSVTPPGRLHRALTEALARLDPAVAFSEFFDLADLELGELGYADGRPPEELGAGPLTEALATADAVVLATPIYRGSLTGSLKNVLDLTPIPALRDTPVALISMGGSHHHYLGAERHLRDVLAFFGALVLPTAVYLSSRDFGDGVPGDRAVSELDALLAAAVTLGAARRGAKPLGPPPLAAGF